MTGTKNQLIAFLQDQPLKDGGNNVILYDLDIHKDKRSLSQNAYAWALVNKIATVTRISKEEVYIEMLRSYGQSEVVPFPKAFDPREIFKYYDVESESMVCGVPMLSLKVYQGTSSMNSYQMSVFIDGLIQECMQLDIETYPRKVIDKMPLHSGAETSEE